MVGYDALEAMGAEVKVVMCSCIVEVFLKNSESFCIFCEEEPKIRFSLIFPAKLYYSINILLKNRRECGWNNIRFFLWRSLAGKMRENLFPLLYIKKNTPFAVFYHPCRYVPTIYNYLAARIMIVGIGPCWRDRAYQIRVGPICM